MHSYIMITTLDIAHQFEAKDMANAARQVKASFEKMAMKKVVVTEKERYVKFHLEGEEENEHAVMIYLFDLKVVPGIAALHQHLAKEQNNR